VLKNLPVSLDCNLDISVSLADMRSIAELSETFVLDISVALVVIFEALVEIAVSCEVFFAVSVL